MIICSSVSLSLSLSLFFVHIVYRTLVCNLFISISNKRQLRNRRVIIVCRIQSVCFSSSSFSHYLLKQLCQKLIYGRTEFLIYHHRRTFSIHVTRFINEVYFLDVSPQVNPHFMIYLFSHDVSFYNHTFTHV